MNPSDEAPTHLLVLDAATMVAEKKSMHTTISARTIDRCGGLQVGHGEVLEWWRVQAPPLWRSPRQVRCRSSLPPCLLLLVPHRGAPWVPSRSSTDTRDAALPSCTAHLPSSSRPSPTSGVVHFRCRGPGRHLCLPPLPIRGPAPLLPCAAGTRCPDGEQLSI